MLQSASTRVSPTLLVVTVSLTLQCIMTGYASQGQSRYAQTAAILHCVLEGDYAAIGTCLDAVVSTRGQEHESATSSESQAVKKLLENLRECGVDVAEVVHDACATVSGLLKTTNSKSSSEAEFIKDQLDW